ncbi:MAG: hypothetical protein M0Z77_08745 [Thermoplasmatales archaeon]|nr:hypothetical protein [Thermoplasmatales archaeon]
MWTYSPDKKWRLNLTPEGIELEQLYSKDWWFPKGIYETLKEPYCKKCSNLDLLVFKADGKEEAICMNCSNLKWVDRIYSIGPYYPVRNMKHNESLLSKHINALKQDKSLAVPLGTAMTLAINEIYPQIATYDYIVPVPTDKTTLSERKFNHSEELARVVGEGTGISALNFLIKSEKLSFKDLERDERFEAANRVFSLSSDRPELLNKKILIIDDVSTTGATSDALSRLLKQNGVHEVSVLVAGRTFRPSKEDPNVTD